MAVPENLQEVADRIHETGEPHRETVRTILSWFGQQRRGRWVVSRIRSALRELDLTTFPDFETAYVDGVVELRSTREAGGDRGAHPPVGEGEEDEGDRSDGRGDPVARIRMLAAANRRPVCVTRDARVRDAVTEMMMNDFSQLPVMPNEREVNGMISWKSIGQQASLGRRCEFVRECMEPAETIPADMPLLTAIPLIVEHEVVLIRETDKTISGLVTTSDVSQQFQELAEPFLLVGEIENHIRSLIDGKFTPDELKEAADPGDAERQIEGVEDLTFGEYTRLLENPDSWARAGIELDRARVIKRLHRTREIRNDVMHFSPDGISPEDREFLRDTVAFMQRLQ